MPLVAHKYMVDEMPVEELKSTFAAREHTLDYLVRSIRGQNHANTLTSYLITGPRGAGKTTIVRMMCLRIQEDDELKKHWLPVRFPEELPAVVSFRDLLAAALERLAEKGIVDAGNAHARVEAETNDEQSEQLAINALRHISSQQGRRLILFIENLDQIFDRAIDGRSAAALRRLLMVEPFLMIVGTALRQFEALQQYDQAFFNYFCPVPLGRLSDAQVREMLFRRASFDGNEQFAQQYEHHRAKIQAITQLTGGNPRLIMMLYEVLDHGGFHSAITTLRKLVDDLTPLLKDMLDHQLSDQQGKILDAIMRAEGTSTPADIARATRVSLNGVTRQLQRLKEMQIVEVLGGGKGQSAYYTIPDQLFCTWYRMRYLRPHRRRIEMFVEILRVWFETDVRLSMLRSLAAKAEGLTGRAALDTCTSIEYFGASLVATPYEKDAKDLAVGTWLRLGHMNEAAMALVEWADTGARDLLQREISAYAGLADWAAEHGDLRAAVEAALAATAKAPNDLSLQIRLGVLLGRVGDHQDAITIFSRVLDASPSDRQLVAEAMGSRGRSKGLLGDRKGAIADCSAVIEMEEASTEHKAKALFNRAVNKGNLGDREAELADYSAIIEMAGAPIAEWALALINRGVKKAFPLGNVEGALADYSTVVDTDGAPKGLVALALLDRAGTKSWFGRPRDALSDYSAIIELDRVEPKMVAIALVFRGECKQLLGDVTGALADCSAAIKLEEIPGREAAMAMCTIGDILMGLGRSAEASDHLLRSIKEPDADESTRLRALNLALPLGFRMVGEQGVRAVVLAANEGTAKIASEQRIEVFTSLVRELAEPETKVLWLAVLRSLLADGPVDVAESLEFFRPVAEVLESGDFTRLDPLPPEQREFAKEVLRQFDPI